MILLTFVSWFLFSVIIHLVAHMFWITLFHKKATTERERRRLVHDSDIQKG